MTTPTLTVFPDLLGDLRVEARNAILPSLLGRRVFFAMPDKPVWPLVRVYDTGGGPEGGEVPMENRRVAWDIWGRPRIGDKANLGAGTFEDVTAIVLAIKSWLHDLYGPIGNTGSTWVLNAEVTNAVPSPDPDAGAARYLIDSLFTIRPN